MVCDDDVEAVAGPAEGVDMSGFRPAATRSWMRSATAVAS